ncbi:hypothetical protein CPB84DRAFT_1843539 [Gymnopilus junonius]|uniref:Uncharacterized protein n=1 Tax=Gymnopilus junonius TaxID=109634 RepID=A0A9P5NW40_GYMJU|nr:hypothetical protein CPB84DRAFT_1843539 [Gymnopilus junonius]
MPTKDPAYAKAKAACCNARHSLHSQSSNQAGPSHIQLPAPANPQTLSQILGDVPGPAQTTEACLPSHNSAISTSIHARFHSQIVTNTPIVTIQNPERGSPSQHHNLEIADHESLQLLQLESHREDEAMAEDSIEEPHAQLFQEEIAALPNEWMQDVFDMDVDGEIPMANAEAQMDREIQLHNSQQNTPVLPANLPPPPIPPNPSPHPDTLPSVAPPNPLPPASPPNLPPPARILVQHVQHRNPIPVRRSARSVHLGSKDFSSDYNVLKKLHQ